MDQLLPDVIPAVRDMVRAFMKTEVAPVFEDFEKRQQLPRELIRKAGEAGLYGSVFPEAVGGTGMGYAVSAAILEEVARAEVRFTVCSNPQGGTCPTCIYMSGTDAQIQKYVPKLISGETIGMMALSEPGSGSDPAESIRTTAVRDGDVYRINGSKMWTTMGNECDVGVLFAKTDLHAGAKGVTAFIVEPKKYPGFTATPIDMPGLSKSFRTCSVFLDDFVVPVENRLGEEGEGFKIIMRAFQPGRVVIAAKALGIAVAMHEDAIAYANERSSKGQLIGRYQMVQSLIAEMAVEIEASRALVYKAAMHLDAGLPSNRLASIAKFHATKTAKFCTDAAQQIFGGYGLTAEFRISRYNAYADMLFNGEGTANVQKILIAEDALGYKMADRHHGNASGRKLGASAFAAE